MIRHFAADGTVKQEWAEGLYASPRFERFGKQFVEVAKSNAIEMVEVADGEQVGETFVAAIASALAEAGAKPFIPQLAADVHPIEAALSATSDVATLSAPETPENVDKPITIVEGTGPDPKILPPVAIAPEPEPSDIVMGTGPDAKPMIETELGELVPAPVAPNAQQIVENEVAATHVALTPTIPIRVAIPGSTTEHHGPSPSEVVEIAAHALSDAAAVLKQEEERNTSNAGAEK